MNSLDSQITALYTLAHRLLHLGSDGNSIYSDHFSWLSGNVFSHTSALCPHHGSTDEEEARLCLSLLVGYNTAIYNNGDREVRIQQVLNRCQEISDRLPTPLLKVQLPTYCYGEVFDNGLPREMHSIIDSWGGRVLSGDECEIAEQLHSLEENPYPDWEVGG